MFFKINTVDEETFFGKAPGNRNNISIEYKNTADSLAKVRRM